MNRESCGWQASFQVVGQFLRARLRLLLGNSCSVRQYLVTLVVPRATTGRGSALAAKQQTVGVNVLQRETPNPSIEGMPKRLRLLCTPHVKR